MSLEDMTGTDKFISSFNNANPDGSVDKKFQGDDHLRGIKNVLINTLQNIDCNLLDAIYPIGSIFMSTANVNPSLKIGGTWSVMQTGRMLISEDGGATYTAGDTGGSKDAVNVVHDHTYSGTTGNQSANHTHTDDMGQLTSPYTKPAAGGGTTLGTMTTNNNSVSHTHPYSGTTASSGVSGTDANMSPYLAVYMWTRIA